MASHRFTAVYIENTFRRLPKATGGYVRWQHLRAALATRAAELTFLFSTDIGLGLAGAVGRWLHPSPLVYVGFTQDGIWPESKVQSLARALQRCRVVTVFSEDERSLYLDRYGLHPDRARVIPIHTDETGDYREYQGPPLQDGPYVLSLGSPNRRFTPVARACHSLGIPLVIVTRPTHRLDSLDELASLGARIVTDAGKIQALTWLHHARFAVMAFDTDQLPGAFTTLIHGMFLGTPAVVSNCLGMRDYIAHGENGLIVPHRDEQSLRDAIGNLWNDPARVSAFAENGRQRAARLHSLNAAADHFDALIDELLVEPQSKTVTAA